jgi:hypothetical protein
MADNNNKTPDDASPLRKSKKSSPLPPPPKFHSTTERLPVLESAPPSASTSFNVADLPPPPKMTGATLTVAPTLAPTLVPVPPPPPPPRVEPTSIEPLIDLSDLQYQLEQEASTTLKEPLRLPRISSEHSVLARRQSRIPVLLIASEAAHKMAWKNNLKLVDLLSGLSEQVAKEAENPLPPFRSVHRSMLLHWDSLQLEFMEPSDYVFEENLLEEYIKEHQDSTSEDDDILEELVESILLENHPEEREQDFIETRRHARLQQASQQAFDLTLKPDASSPWLNQYRNALDASTDMLTHEIIQAPALVLLVCTSNDFAPPIDCLRELSSPHFLPRQFFDGIYDRSTLRAEALVLHDVVDGGNELNEISLKQSLVQQFGGGAAIVKMNSVMPETAARMQDASSEIWGDASRGVCLSPNDRLVLKRYLETMITSSLLPALERRISDLNFIVTDRKKGVKNVFKSLWRKPKEEGGSTTPSSQPKPKQVVETSPTVDGKSNVKYRCDSIESQVRLLADTLFLVRDWDAALGMYRLIKEDYKADKAMLEYGSVNEMMGLATYMMDPVGRAQESFSYMESALYSYTRATEEERPAGAATSRPSQASNTTRLATRLCLVMASANEIIHDRPLEVADLLASASSHETPLGAAVLLEQSSLHYYRAGMFRKYAFHMLMSGHMFRTALQEHHAFRCFTSALYIYHDGRWDELHNHLRSALAAQMYSLGRMSASVELYAKLVGTHSGGRVSTKSQQKFVQHLQEICQHHTEKAMLGADRMASEDHTERLDRIEHILRVTEGASRILELPNIDLPSIDDSSVTVTVESEQEYREYPSFGALGDGDPEVWEELKCHAEAELKAVDPTSRFEDGSPTLAKIEDPLIRRVVAAIDKEKASMNLLAKAKRSGSYKESPAVRARMEPLSVQFVVRNPLSIPISVERLQLVARMTQAGSNRICTNEDAIAIGEQQADHRSWTFSNAKVVYESPEFCRISGSSSMSWKSTANEGPFFVVSKFDMTLAPNTSIKVSLGICPLVLGDLEILGVRCKLFDDVWVFHPFNVKGPLLQNTSENRAKRVRAESMILKAKIEQDMPLLTADLIPKRELGGEGPMLVGQMSYWTLRLSNNGTAPSANVSLKTNLPWVSIDSVSGPTLTSQPSPHCIGPSGTLTELPLDDPTLKTPGVLEPGESVDIPIIIRTADGGNHDFYMLYRYELYAPASSSSSKAKRRWLQDMFHVPASPSLTLTASLMPSFWKQHEYVLSVEMTNYRSDKSSELDVVLDKLCILSRHYRMELLEGQLGAFKMEASPFRLGWQERVTLHYRVIPIEDSSTSCMLSECQFAKEGVEVAECLAGPTTNYLCMERAQQEFQVSSNYVAAVLVRPLFATLIINET